MFKQKTCYCTETYESEENYHSDFFQSFTYEDFTYLFDLNNDVTLQLFPTKRLSIFNEDLNEPSMADLFQKLAPISNLYKKVKNGFVRNCKLLTPEKYIRRSFWSNWELQADGDQTNATMQMSSIKTFADSLKDIVKSNTMFLDCGSSYGSLFHCF